MARQINQAKTAYSVKCAPFRASRTTRSRESFEMWGNSHWTRGAMMREDRLNESESLEAE